MDEFSNLRVMVVQYSVLIDDDTMARYTCTFNQDTNAWVVGVLVNGPTSDDLVDYWYEWICLQLQSVMSSAPATQFVRINEFMNLEQTDNPRRYK